jgi:hypothetical protein
MRRLALGLLGASIAVALGVADPASASSVRLTFDPALVESGTNVWVEGVSDSFRGSRGARLLLAAARVAPRIRSVEDRRLIPVARMLIDARSASAFFRVPALTPGRYAAFVYCAQCRTKLRRVRPSPRPFQVFEALRECNTAVLGGFAPEVRERSLRVGPILFVDAALSFPPDRPPPYEKKIPLQIETRSLVTLIVPPEERQSVELVYTATGRRTASVTFEPCKVFRAFTGGVVVTEPKCVRLHAQIEGRPGVLPVALSAGRPCP